MLVRCGVLLAVVACAAACAETPTGPTATPSAATVAIIPQTPPPVPPRSHTGPLNAVGATRFVSFGDSITYGTISSADGTMLYELPSHSYPVRLRLGLNAYHRPQTFTVINRGIPGETAAGGASRVASTLGGDRPQALLLLEGINDLGSGRSVSATLASLESILNTARLYNVPVIMATMFRTYQVEGPDGRVRENASSLVPALNSGIRQLAAGRQNVFLVELDTIFGSNRNLVGGDGLHPTEQGYEVMATAFLTVVETSFPVRGSFQ